MGRRHRHKIEQKEYATLFLVGLPSGSVVKNLPAKAEEVGSVPGSGRAPGERKMATLQYSCLGNPMDRGAWGATTHGVAKSQTRHND